MPSISGLITISALTAVESNLVKKKTDYNAKKLHIESKYITTTDYNKFTKDIVDNSIKSKELFDKSDIS